MSKKIRKFFLIGLLCINLISIGQIQVIATENQTSLQEQMKLIQNDIKIDDLDIEPINTDDLKKKVVPDAKKEGKKVIFLFFKTILLVAFSGAIIYVCLMLVRKYRASDFAEVEYDEFAMLNLASPESKQEAFMSFLNRTGF